MPTPTPQPILRPWTSPVGGSSAGPMKPLEDYVAAPAELQPTGLQGLPQQGMPGFGMQSPTPFGTQQPFNSSFGGFGQKVY